jgi:hypothetical protein
VTEERKSNVDMARAAWGKAAPEWVIVLAEACDPKHSSQAAVAARLGVSSAMINQALKNTYTGRLDKLEQRVRGELMKQCVACPVLGEITKRRCIDEQSRTQFAPTNAVRVELRRACPRCVNFMRKSA